MRSFTGRWDICRSAGWWEPDEPRGSRPVLREAEGEIPSAYSPDEGPHLSCSDGPAISADEDQVTAALFLPYR